jgi:hypothetical protein
VLVVFGVEAVERAGAVLSEVEERGISGLGLAVVDVGDGGASVGEALRRVFEGLGRRSFGFSIEPRRTLRRFGSEGSCFAVAVDARGVVRRVERVRASGEAPAAVAAAVDALGGAGGG